LAILQNSGPGLRGIPWGKTRNVLSGDSIGLHGHS